MDVLIKQVSIKGFKNAMDEKLFTLYPQTEVEGDNGVGKTSIGDAIAYGLYGCSLNGGIKLDDLMHNGSKEMAVGLQVALDGVEHIITRTRRGNTSTLTMNGHKVNQDEVARLLPAKDVFFTIFNPDYFLALSERESRDIISKYLKPVTKNEILTALDAYENGILVKNPFLDPHVFLDDLNGDLKASKQDILKAQGALESYTADLVEAKKATGEAMGFDDSEIVIVKQHMEIIRKDQRVEITAINDQISELNKEIAIKLSSKPQLKEVPTADSLSREIVAPETIDTSENRAEMDRLHAQWKFKKEQIDKMATLGVDQVCPTCAQPMSAEHIEKTQQALLGENSLITICAQALQVLLDETNAVNEKAWNEWKLQMKQEENTVEAVIAGVKSENEALERQFAKDSEADRMAINGQIDDLKTKQINLQNSTEGKIAELNMLLEDLQAKKQHVLLHNQAVDNATENVADLQEKIENQRVNIADYTAEKNNTELVISVVKAYIMKQVEMQADQLKAHLNKVAIALKTVVKTTGEVKDCFKITYEGKGLGQISASERIKAALEISHLMKQLSGYMVPVFVDNAESITASVQPTAGQCIACRVVKGSALCIREVV